MAKHSGKPIKFKVGRDAESGRFKTVKWAKDHRKQGIVETVKRPGK